LSNARHARTRVLRSYYGRTKSAVTFSRRSFRIPKRAQVTDITAVTREKKETCAKNVHRREGRSEGIRDDRSIPAVEDREFSRSRDTSFPRLNDGQGTLLAFVSPHSRPAGFSPQTELTEYPPAPLHLPVLSRKRFFLELRKLR